MFACGGRLATSNRPKPSGGCSISREGAVASGGDCLKMLWSLSRQARDFYQHTRPPTCWINDSRFRPGLMYSMLTSNQATFRVFPRRCWYDKGGPAFHPHRTEDTWLLLALCNSCFADRAFDVLNPTMNLQVQDVKNLPVAEFEPMRYCRLIKNVFVWCSGLGYPSKHLGSFQSLPVYLCSIAFTATGVGRYRCAVPCSAIQIDGT